VGTKGNAHTNLSGRDTVSGVLFPVRLLWRTVLRLQLRVVSTKLPPGANFVGFPGNQTAGRNNWCVLAFRPLQTTGNQEHSGEALAANFVTSPPVRPLKTSKKPCCALAFPVRP